MKYYLLNYCIKDNGHEYYQYITTQAKDLEEANRKGGSQEHEMRMVEDGEEPAMTMFDFGDGETVGRFKCAMQINKTQMEVLDETAVAHFYLL